LGVQNEINFNFSAFWLDFTYGYTFELFVLKNEKNMYECNKFPDLCALGHSQFLDFELYDWDTETQKYRAAAIQSLTS